MVETSGSLYITNHIHMTTSVSQRLNMTCIMFQVIPIFIITLFDRVIGEVWYFNHMWKALALPHNFAKRECLGPLN